MKMRFFFPRSGLWRAVVGVLLFVFCFLLCDRALFLLVSGAEEGFNRRLAALHPRERTPRGFFSTLIFGSSRTYRGIHPLYFWQKLHQRALKEARGKKRLKYDYLFYLQFRELHGPPRLVVMGLDYFMFKYPSDERALLQVDGKYARVARRNRGVSLLLANKPRFDQFFNDLLNRADEERKEGGGGDAMELIDTFVGYPHQPGVLTEHKGVDFHRVSYRSYPGEEGEYLLRLLQETGRDGVTVALVMIPDYIGTYETNFQRDIFRRDIENLARPFPHAHILDYNDPAVFPLQESRYFLDGGYGNENSHLSAEGAQVFNTLLLRDLRRLYRGGA